MAIKELAISMPGLDELGELVLRLGMSENEALMCYTWLVRGIDRLTEKDLVEYLDMFGRLREALPVAALDNPPKVVFRGLKLTANAMSALDKKGKAKLQDRPMSSWATSERDVRYYITGYPNGVIVTSKPTDVVIDMGPKFVAWMKKETGGSVRVFNKREVIRKGSGLPADTINEDNTVFFGWRGGDIDYTMNK